MINGKLLTGILFIGSIIFYPDTVGIALPDSRKVERTSSADSVKILLETRLQSIDQKVKALQEQQKILKIQNQVYEENKRTVE